MTQNCCDSVILRDTGEFEEAKDELCFFVCVLFFFKSHDDLLIQDHKSTGAEEKMSPRILSEQHLREKLSST